MSQGLLNSIGRIPRNKLLNPDSAIDQRNGGAAVLNTTSSTAYSTDRSAFYGSVAGKLTAQQYAVALGAAQPSNFSHKISVTAQYTLVAGDYFLRTQRIEGYRMRDLLWGSSFARPMVYTIQGMWPVAGDYSFAVQNGAGNRSYVTKFTVQQANTLETHTVLVQGDTSGTWPVDNTAHSNIFLALGVGSTYTTATINQWQAGNFVKAAGTVDLVSQANGSAMYIAWEQYERDMRTDFILPDYDDEFRHCRRYYQGYVNKYGSKPASAYSRNSWLVGAMRAAPTVNFKDMANNAGKVSTYAANDTRTDNRTPVAVGADGAFTNSLIYTANNTDTDIAFGFQYELVAEL